MSRDSPWDMKHFTDGQNSVWVVYDQYTGELRRYDSVDEMPVRDKILAEGAQKCRPDVLEAILYKVLDVFYPEARFCGFFRKDHSWCFSTDVCSQEECWRAKESAWQDCPYLEGRLTPEDFQKLQRR